jgi:hypothetical protein
MHLQNNRAFTVAFVAVRDGDVYFDQLVESFGVGHRVRAVARVRVHFSGSRGVCRRLVG